MKQGLVVSLILTVNEFLICRGFSSVVDIRQSLQAGVAFNLASHLVNNRIAAIGINRRDALNPCCAVQVNVIAAV